MEYQQLPPMSCYEVSAAASNVMQLVDCLWQFQATNIMHRTHIVCLACGLCWVVRAPLLVLVLKTHVYMCVCV
jgi:hypothetical protein